ncbi:hypothetical protein CEXT_80631 [Caerostris extrusa]|uniref:Uncharacterized protein n=1 Tax=Caerostris extrusa TaxID=172846 RepID=A0AAV4TLM3_CAEEX|nr:hypothetical protein CEXT_80631 [Caerostris extrusa]
MTCSYGLRRCTDSRGKSCRGKIGPLPRLLLCPAQILFVPRNVQELTEECDGCAPVGDFDELGSTPPLEDNHCLSQLKESQQIKHRFSAEDCQPSANKNPHPRQITSKDCLLECPAAVTVSERKLSLHHSFKPPTWRLIDHLQVDLLIFRQAPFHVFFRVLIGFCLSPGLSEVDRGM